MNREPIRVDRHEQAAGPRMLFVLLFSAAYLCAGFWIGCLWADCESEYCRQVWECGQDGEGKGWHTSECMEGSWIQNQEYRFPCGQVWVEERPSK